jgi:hypothetical protein
MKFLRLINYFFRPSSRKIIHARSNDYDSHLIDDLPLTIMRTSIRDY